MYVRVLIAWNFPGRRRSCAKWTGHQLRQKTIFRQVSEKALCDSGSPLSLPASLLSIALPDQRLLDTEFLPRLQVIPCARIARGNAHSLYRNAFVLGAIVTAILSLDTTAVMLPPVMLAVVKRIKLPAAPYILLCAFVANEGSLVLPISNLTNILFADAFHLTFAAFAARMVGAQIVALVATYAILRGHFRRELPNRFGESLPEAASGVPNRAYFLVSVTVPVVVLVGYILAPIGTLEPYVIAFAGSGVLMIAGAATRCVRIRAAGELS